MTPNEIMALAEEAYMSGIVPTAGVNFEHGGACVLGAALYARDGTKVNSVWDFYGAFGQNDQWIGGVTRGFDGSEPASVVVQRRSGWTAKEIADHNAGHAFGQAARAKFLSPAPKEQTVNVQATADSS